MFGCLCYPNLSATAAHKLAPHSTPCVFLGYPSDHKGYRCLDLSTNRLIISRHVTFDETTFPVAQVTQHPSSDFDFLSEFDGICVSPICPITVQFSGTPAAVSHAPSDLAVVHAAPPPYPPSTVAPVSITPQVVANCAGSEAPRAGSPRSPLGSIVRGSPRSPLANRIFSKVEHAWDASRRPDC